MRLNFRQGLISFQQVGSQPYFLIPGNSNFVSLNISPAAFVATIAHGSSDYLLKFDSAIQNAWGPMIGGQNNYLYFQINLVSGEITRGLTALEPISSITEPVGAAPNQMWFDLNQAVMKVRTADGRWIVSPRLVVGVVLNGNTGTIAHYTVGSSVGLNTESKPGFLLYDTMGRALRTQSGELLTSDTEVRVRNSSTSAGVLTNPINNFIPVRATEAIPAMRLVYFTGPDTVGLASSNPALIIPQNPVGLCEVSLAQNEAGVIVQAGEVTWEQWNWAPSDCGKPVYCGFNGEITLTRPQSIQAFRVGYVKNAKTILFGIDAEIQPQIVSQPGSILSGVFPIQTETVVNQFDEVVTSISIVPASVTQNGFMSAEQVETLESFDGRLNQALIDIDDLATNKADVVHEHVIADVANLQSALDDLEASIDLKISKVPTATIGNLAAFTAGGEVIDSGFSTFSFAPTEHEHSIAEIENLQTILNDKADADHTHVIADVTGLQEELDGKASFNHTQPISSINGLELALSDKADVEHQHEIEDVNGLLSVLDNKADVVHGHSIEQIDLLQAALDSRALVVHEHQIADVSGLADALLGKADAQHNHEIADVSGLIDALSSKADVEHDHVISDVFGLSDALLGKANVEHLHQIEDVFGLAHALDGKADVVCTFDFTVGPTGDFPTLEAALADENVIDGTSILLQSGTYVIPATINFTKQVKIYGEDLNSTIIQTSADTAAPLVMMNVTVDNVVIYGITFKHLKTNTNSTESIIAASGGGFPQTRISNFVLDSCRLEFMCFGITTRSTGLKIANTKFVAIGANTGTRRAIGIYGSAGDTFIVGNEALNLTSPVRALRFISILSTTGNNPNETNSGRIIVEDNIHSVANGPLTQFMIQDNFQGAAGALELIAKRNVIQENNAAFVFVGATANFGDLYSKISLQNNSITNVHAVDGGKGLLGVDGTGAFRSAALPVHAANNVLGQTVFRTGWIEATGSTNALVGRALAIADFTVALSAVIDASPSVPKTSAGTCTVVAHRHEIEDVKNLQLALDAKISFANTSPFTPSSDYNPASKLYVDSRTLDDLSNVSVTAPAPNQVLTWDGSQWVAAEAGGGSGNLPTGGAAGTYLEKLSGADYDAVWTDRVNAKTIYENVKNVSGVTLPKGTPVYKIGIVGNTPTVGIARADDPDKLAMAVLDEELIDEAEGRALVLGEIRGVDTSSFATGDFVYLGTTGGYTNVKPTASDVAVQFLGVVFRAAAAPQGSGFITGTLTPDLVKFQDSKFYGWNGTDWIEIDSDKMTVKTAPSDYTATIDDGNGRTLVRLTASTPVQFTIPAESAVNFPIGSVLLIGQAGIGQVEIVGAVGVTVNSPESFFIRKQHGKVSAIKVGTNEWDLEGNLQPL